MNKRATYKDIHMRPKGKLTDKWDLYLDIYGKVLEEYRDSRIRLLEIGIQNGGSLETWAEYFSHAELIIGCDIDQACRDLSFEDKRIRLVIGDATELEVSERIGEISNDFNVIVEDGSHESRDIIRSFNMYFPMLAPGGVYIAEDLHCCYWKEYGGGLNAPYSGIEYFKLLCDCLNSDYWNRDDITVQEYTGQISQLYDSSIDPEILRSVFSIQFYDSVCIITKASQGQNPHIGNRIFGGEEELVTSSLAKQSSELLTMPHPTQRWESLVEANNNNQRLNDEIFLLRSELSKTQKGMDTLLESVDECRMQLSAIKGSTSWKISSPLRGLTAVVKKAVIAAVRLAKQSLAVDRSRILERGDSSTLVDEIAHRTDSFDLLSGGLIYRQDQAVVKDYSKIIAFYLPQYHRIKENSEWWGPGFTEWTNVVTGKPNYLGHYQPHLPRDLGFYDLSNIEVMREQAEMASLYGIYAFCFYYYWFSGRRILEKPINAYLKSDIDFKYCLCWANENWTRTWDGDTKSVLLGQNYEEDDPELFIESLFPFFEDSRYVTVDNKPLLLVYRAKDIPNVKDVFRRWKQIALMRGYKGLHIVVVDFYDISHPNEVDADALVEFPPHKFNGPENMPETTPVIINSDFKGHLVDYKKMVAQSLRRIKPDFCLYRCLVPSWDNTARRQNTPTIVYGSKPSIFKSWLYYLRRYTSTHFAGREDNFVFVNAWNEWGEGCHLEPDHKWGLSYLEAVKSTTWCGSHICTLEEARNSTYKDLCDDGLQEEYRCKATENVEERLFEARRYIRSCIYKFKSLVKKMCFLPFD